MPLLFVGCLKRVFHTKGGYYKSSSNILHCQADDVRSRHTEVDAEVSVLGNENSILQRLVYLQWTRKDMIHCLYRKTSKTINDQT